MKANIIKNFVRVIFIFTLVIFSYSLARPKDGAFSLDRIKSLILSGDKEKAIARLDKHLIKYPKDKEALYIKGSLLKRAENYNEAIIFFERALRVDPSDFKIKQILGDVYLEKGEPQRALQIFNELLKEGHKTEAIYRKIGRIYLIRKDYQKASDSLMKSSKIDLKKGISLCLLGDLYKSRGLEVEALSYYDKAYKRGYKNKNMLVNFAVLLEDAGEIDRAIKINKEIVNLYYRENNLGLEQILLTRKDLSAHRSLTRLYRKKKDIVSSIKWWISCSFNGISFNSIIFFFIMLFLFFMFFNGIFKFVNTLILFPVIVIAGIFRKLKWLKSVSRLSILYELDYAMFFASYLAIYIEPEDYESLINLAIFYDKRDDYKKSSKYYQKVLDLNPEMDDVWFLFGVLKQRMSKFRESEFYIKKAIDINYENSLYWYHLSIAYYEQEMFPEALESSLQALQLFSSFIPSLEIFIECCKFTGEIELCEDTLSKLIEEEPDNPNLITAMGAILLRSGKKAESISCFQKALELAPDFSETWVYLGVAQREMGMLDNAVKSLKRALELEPQESILYIYLGLTYLKKGRFKDAEDIFRQVLKLNPTSSYTHYLLGKILKDENSDKAKIHMLKAIECFNQEKPDHQRPWQMAKNYEYITKAYDISEQKDKARETLQKALNFAKITPKSIQIFSDEKLEMVTPEEFIENCNKKIELQVTKRIDNMEVPFE